MEDIDPFREEPGPEGAGGESASPGPSLTPTTGPAYHDHQLIPSEPTPSTPAVSPHNARPTENQSSSAQSPNSSIGARPFPTTIAAVTVPGRGGRPTLRDLKDVEQISVIDAIKTSDGGTSTYIAYEIQSSVSQWVFEFSCTLLMRPRIDRRRFVRRESLGDYASHPASMTKTKEDPATVARRRRMLAVFLNRLVRHPVLGREKILWRFLSEDSSWSEVLHQPPLTTLPKNPLRAPAHNPTDPDLQALFFHLPLPSSPSVPLQEPDQRFLDSEVFTQKFSSHLTGSLEKINRRLVKRWTEHAVDQAELGGVLNGFALVEGSVVGDGQLSTQEAAEATGTAIERTGQTVDATYMATNAMAQFEMARDTLDTKRLVLEDLERSESDAQRLESALNRVRQLDLQRSSGGESDDPSAVTSHVIGSTGPTIISPIRKPAPTGFLGALRHSLNGITDVDPESTRRNSISRHKDYIGNLEEGLRAAAADLRYCSQTIQADLDRFQRQKVADLKEMCLAFARFHIQLSKNNLEQWQAAKEDIMRVVTDE